jgi:hypothetical protein
LGRDASYQAVLIDIHYTNFGLMKRWWTIPVLKFSTSRSPLNWRLRVFAIGGAPNPFGFDGIPIEKGTSQHKLKCPQSCFAANWAEPVTIFAEGFHMHKNGARAISQVWRDEIEVVHQATAEVWDYDQNGVKLIQQDQYQMIPGRDSLNFFCYYNSPFDDLVFGQETLQEMCIDVSLVLLSSHF